MSDVTEQSQTKMKAAIEHLKADLKTIRTGRANTGMLDSVHVDIYGSQMRIRDLGSVTTPESRQLLITPYDRTNTAAIAKSIEKANLGFMPVVEGQAIRITIPPMDEAMRKEMAKQCHKKQEETKVGIRHVRRDCVELLRKLKSDGTVTEDQLKRLEKQIQDQTDKFCAEADAVVAAKEKEIFTV